MNVNGNTYNAANNIRYNRYSAFSKPSGDKDIASGTSGGSAAGVIYDKGSKTNSKVYTSGSTLQGAKTSTSKTKYSAQEILNEIDKCIRAGQIYAIWNNGKETWLQGIEPGRNGGPVGSKKYFDPNELRAALGKGSPKSISIGNNAVTFDNNSYYKFIGKDGKEHTVLSLGGVLHKGLFGNRSYAKEAADYVDFWNALGRENPSGVNARFSSGEIRDRLAEAGIQNGFFTVTIGGRSATHFLSQGKNSLAVYSQEQYDKRYQAIKDGTMFKRYAGSAVTIGGKEYSVGADGKVDIAYGEDVFDILAQAQERA